MYLGRYKDIIADEYLEEANNHLLELIRKMDSFEQKCLANVEKIELPTKEQIDGIIEEKELYITLYQVQKQLFMNKGMIFFSDSMSSSPI